MARALFLAMTVMAADTIARMIFGSHAHRQKGGGIRWLRVLVNAVGGVSLALAALTAGRLIWHVSVGPAFALAAVAVTVFWAHRNRFSAADWRRLGSVGTWAVPLRKFFFWAALILAVPTLVSILAAMFPLYGTEGQQNLLQVHKFCGLLLAAAGLLFAYFAAMAWREGSTD